MEGLISQVLEIEIDANLEEISVENIAQLELQLELLDQTTTITLYVLLGSPFLSTMRVQGKINHQEMVILIDTGNTHNFFGYFYLDVVKTVNVY